ncbi:MAG: primosomal protein N' [Bacteroidetes bacterium]|nr:MAG: primosomal protein N' [Bacteroidota bacterium]MBL1144237.1 primosomal protein N' [Bacteroidota bacterium]NOG57033.1 primosomal protein N' [Bacteroidota bacterium]
MSERETKFVEVIMPLALPNTFSYRVPHEWNDAILVGQRVIVQFGFKGNKQYSAIVAKVHQTPPEAYEAKYIEAILDENPILHPIQLKFWEWISDYYMAHIGDVMVTALPGGLRLASETRVLLHPEYQQVVEDLLDDEYLVVEALELRNVLDLDEISQILGIKHVQPKIKALIEKKAIMVEEEIKQRYKPKLIAYVKLTKQAEQEENLKKIFDEIEKAPRQLELLMTYIQMSSRYSSSPKEVKKIDLQKASNSTSSLVNELVKKEIFEVYEVEAGRIDLESASNPIKELSEDQEKAYAEINTAFESKDVVLLHGVTSSGKTEVYIKLIKEAVERGEQVLYLLPEIALTTQIVRRLQLVFGERVCVYHSRFNENERVEVWNNVLKFNPGHYEDFQIVLGARSALFLPFSKLGLVIVDEEHENTFKQYDPSPRYQARDASIVLAGMHGGKVVLGSATPSVESYRNAQEGKFALVNLNKRFGGVQLPEILCADVKEASKRKKMNSHFTPELLKMMQDHLEDKKQIILFQNRRGYSPILMCETCGNAPQCVNCDVSLTYHKYKRELNCHYCGHHTALPKVCPSCGDTNLQVKGFGTEKIEEELAIYLPQAKIARMDLDTTRAKKAYHRIINAFEDKEIDILVGTQMVTKGLDFENVGLVGVLNADNMLHFPDFRAFERSYQLMAQVSGRAGRKGKRGQVLIQTYNPNHQIIRQVIDNDYLGMYKNELIDRRNFHYPPFYRLIKLTLKHRDEKILFAGANHLTSVLREKFGTRILGPEAPGIARVRNFYHQNILLKIEKEASIKKSKSLLKMAIQDFAIHSAYKSIRVVIDVDPL